MTKIEKIIEDSLAGMKRAKCIRRIGGLLATVPLPLAILRLIPDATVEDIFPWFDRNLAIQILVIIVSLGVLMYITGVILFSVGKGQLANEIRTGKDFRRVKGKSDEIVERLRRLGAQGTTIDSFISKDTLSLLLNKNPDYVQAWGVPVTGMAIPTYNDVCFFVVAALNPGWSKGHAAGCRWQQGNQEQQGSAARTH